ncbi:DnaJ-domain-containing protein [Cladochytrium replicatum]|nr:DnaJ-domain-containing protein [Cladochytrium replicatum]
MESSSEFVDYYALLEITPKSTDDQIRQAYIKQSLKWHPDRSTSPEATAKFQQIAEAYYTLSDQERRSSYDRARRANEKYGGPDKIDAVNVFSSVFDELLIPEVPNPVWFWQPVGSVAGFCLGFIVFNIPGAIFGAYTGSKMGKVRDMKGVSVYEAFSKLGQEKKVRSVHTGCSRKRIG